MQRVSIGEKVPTLGINRVNVADGVKCRAILIDPNPQMKYIAYDNDRKCKVEVDQELLLKYNFGKVSPTFYYLVAKLNTDMKGNVVSDDFVIEYLQLSQNLNNDFADAVVEMSNFHSVLLQKVKKSVEGRDFSYVTAKPSNYEAPASVKEKIESITPQQLDAMWMLIDRATSITPAEYEKRVLDNPNPTQAIAAPQAQPPKQIAVSTPKMPQVEESFVQDNDFGAGDDFSF